MVEFLDSNLFQNIILIATVVVSICIYYARKRQELRNAVSILSLQIRDIETNIECLKAEGLIGEQLQERAYHFLLHFFYPKYH